MPPIRPTLRRALFLACAGPLLLLASGCGDRGADCPTCPLPDYEYPFQNPGLSPAERAADLTPRLSLAEKVGQMTQVERTAVTANPEHIAQYGLGSLLSGGGSAPADNSPVGWATMYDGFQEQALDTRWGIPLIYGVDAVHGHNNVYGAVLFPHNIGLGCTGNPELVEEAGRITAREVAGTGLDWTFGPCVAAPRNERWGRTYEGFGETPEINRIMGAAMIRGLQGDDLSDPGTILACAKHFVGDGGTRNGTDQGDASISEFELREIHLPPYEDAVDEGVGSIMASFSSWNGEKVHGSEYLLRDVLKEELGFEGLRLSDWAAIDQLPGDYYSSVVTAVNAGIDMVMVPYDYRTFTARLTEAANAGDVSMDRIDEAVRRILTQKFALGLFETPLSTGAYTSTVGSDEHRAVARQCVRESVVLLKNENRVLPVGAEVTRVHVSGRNADDLGAQCGGWSLTWQGRRGDITIGTTILEGLQETAPAGTRVTYTLDGTETGDADLVVVVVGEDPYAEGFGDRTDLSIHPFDRQVIETVAATGKPFVVVLVSGRPLILDDLLDSCDALLAAWLPGTEGGGIADLLFGLSTPTGRLTHSWPRDMDQIPINVGDPDYDPLFPYGFGLQEWGALSMADNARGWRR